jgi:hypothetical protein
MKKIIGIIILTLISAFLGLFILPLEVETLRWITVESSKQDVWKEISQEDYSWSWGGTKNLWVEGDATFEVTELKEDDFEVIFIVRNKERQEVGSGKVYLEKIPEGLWLRCEYIYAADYAPFARLQDWLHRGEVAIKLDKALKRMKIDLEKKSKNEDG